jgi:hypothetical protein
MTIALVIKVNDGLVLAADSASTMMSAGSDGTMSVSNIYNNANKAFNLHKQLPIGALTWGTGNIGPASISSLAKDVRRRFHGDDHAHDDWKLEQDSYDLKDVAARVKEFLYDEQWKPLVEDSLPANLPEETRPSMGFLIGGYSSDADQPSVYLLPIGGDPNPQPVEVLSEGTGAMWWGQPEAITRLALGVSLDMDKALENMNLGLDPSQRTQFIEQLKAQIARPLIAPAMPIQDAIDLAHFLVETTVKFVRFLPGDKVVGGPIEVATVTKHEGFKWVSRKHFFDNRLNPATEIR